MGFSLAFAMRWRFKLIREMSIANPLWGAPRIHGELLKLGVGIGQTSVARQSVHRLEHR
jgi:hypothetical protein